MTKSTLNHLFLTAASLGIVTSAATLPVFAGTITIDQNGTIYTQSSPQVLGQMTSPAIDAIQAKMKAEGDALLKQYQAGEISFDELKAKKAEIVAKYQAEINAAKQPLIDQANQQAQQTKKQVVSETTKVQVKTTQENKIRVVTEPTQTTISEPIAEENELTFIQETPDAKEVKTKIMAKNQNKYIITNGIAAKVGTPISINLETNEMTITTPAGTKVVSVLPDAALKKARLGANIEVETAPASPSADPINETASDSAQPTASDSSAMSLADDTLALVDYQNTPAYAIKGKAKKNLLGIIPVKIDKTVYVSAVSGNIVNTETTGFDKLLDLLSF